MSKHSEAVNAFKTIAKYCYGRECKTECVFYKSTNKGSCCILVGRKYSPCEIDGYGDEIRYVEQNLAYLEDLEDWERQEQK